MHKLHYLIGLSVIGITGIILVVSLTALSSPQTTRSNAAGPTTVNTGVGNLSTINAGGTSKTLPPQQQPQAQPTSIQTGGTSGSSPQQCIEGPKQLELGDCGAGVGQPVYSGGGTSQPATNVGAAGAGGTTATKDPSTVTLSITGVVCQDDVVIPWTPFEGCQTMTKEEWGTQLGGTLREQMKSLCAGHMSPACGGQPQPQSQSGLQGNCALFPKGDADCNGTVDLYDFKIWLTAYRAKSYDKNADFNSDNVVDLNDFVIWKDNYAL